MKKLLISGCANCPYLNVWNDGLGNGVESITSGTCNHPSWHKELPKPKIEAAVLLEQKEYKIGCPHWCPLPQHM